MITPIIPLHAELCKAQTQPTVQFLILLDKLFDVSLQLLMLCGQGSNSCADVQKHIGWHIQLAHAAVTTSLMNVTA